MLMRFGRDMTGARRFEELVSWQRGHELHVEVWKACNRPPACSDFKFRDLATRAIQAIAKFQRYLRSPAARRNANDRRPQGRIE
jgi:hypothetical protein